MEEVSDEPSNLPKVLKDEDLRQECKDLMSTLPMEPTYKLYQYQGFWYGSWALQGILSCQKHFEANHKDIILVTTPKSGTTWLKALTFALLNRNKYPHTQKNHPLLVTNPHILVPFLESLLYDEKYIVSNLSQFPSPRLLSIHAPYVSLPKSVKESNCKIVYLCRDPKDISVSMWKFMETLMPEIRGSNNNLFDEFFELFCRGVNLYGPFWEHVLEYWKESLKRPEKIMFLRYEQMKLHPTLVLKKLAEFLGCPFSKQELDNGMLDDILKLCSFDNLRNLEANKKGTISMFGFDIENKSFFRRGEIGDGKNFLTIEMVDKINAITQKKFSQYGLNFENFTMV